MNVKCIIILGVLWLNACTLPNENNYEIAQWKGFADAAITYTFDDNTAHQYDIGIALFDKYGYNATFYPVINWEPKWDVFAKAVANGHEVGSHTVTHRNLANIDLSDQEVELRDSKNTIEQMLGAGVCKTMAYPFCSPSDKTLTQKYFIAVRHCQGQIEKASPDDMMNISSIICGDQGDIKTFNDFKNKAVEAAELKGWCVYLLHGIDDDGGYSPVNSEVLDQSLSYFNNNRDKYWVDTFSNVAIYILQRNCLSVTDSKVGRNAIELALNDTLDNTIYNMPVTIRRFLPRKWKNIEVEQNDRAIAFKLEKCDAGNCVVFDAVPDAGLVTITKL